MSAHWYVGKRECGCVRSVVVDDPEDAHAVSQDVARLIKAGYQVQRVEEEEGRKLLASGAKCKHAASAVVRAVSALRIR